MLANQTCKGKAVRDQYPPKLRAFALTLHFYSAKVYDFVRDSFDRCLPHPSTLQKWYSHLNGERGFTEKVMNILAERVKDANANDKEVLCSLLMDEMSVRKHVQWDGKQFRVEE